MPDYSQKLEDLLDHHLISNEELKKKKELGGVGYLLNGNMCLGIYDDLLVVRTGAELAKTLIQRKGVTPYLEENKEYDDLILVAPDVYSHSKSLQKFIDKGIAYTSQLSPKKQER